MNAHLSHKVIPVLAFNKVEYARSFGDVSLVSLSDALKIASGSNARVER